MSNGPNESTVVLWIWIGIGLLFLTTLFITVLVASYMNNIRKNKKRTLQLVRHTQSEYCENTIYLQEKDRKRLAEELHDNIISRLNLIRLNAHHKDKHELNRDLKRSMQQIRELTHNLMPPDLNEILLTDLFEDYIDQVKAGIHVEYLQSVLPKTIISNETKLNIFRMFQELTNNILKHANASNMKVFLRISEENLILTVSDNGKGFITSQNTQGIGLRSIQLRAKQMKANYKLKTRPEEGTQFIILIKINQQQ